MNYMKNFTHRVLTTPLQEMNTVYVNGDRLYNTPSGKLPSVTTVTGWEKSQFFKKWRQDNPKESNRVRDRGNELHSLIEDYLNNKEPDLNLITDNTKDLFIQMKPELDKLDNIIMLEGVVWSENVGLAGRVDCIAEYDGVINIIDFKGSTRRKQRGHIENYLLHATAYALMWQDMSGDKVDDFKILIGCEECCNCQIFHGKTINYVKLLYDTIEKYKTHTEQKQKQMLMFE